jgi:uncharacterized membrane protein YeaQ/YmgE (transglycosylase-associated protein family)
VDLNKQLRQIKPNTRTQVAYFVTIIGILMAGSFGFGTLFIKSEKEVFMYLMLGFIGLMLIVLIYSFVQVRKYPLRSFLEINEYLRLNIDSSQKELFAGKIQDEYKLQTPEEFKAEKKQIEDGLHD